MITNPIRSTSAVREKLLDLSYAHSAKAQKSSYDWKVGVGAISEARSTVMAVPSDMPLENYLDAVVNALQDLLERYGDVEGEYTSGKGVIGDFLHDVRHLKAAR